MRIVGIGLLVGVLGVAGCAFETGQDGQSRVGEPTENAFVGGGGSGSSNSNSNSGGGSSAGYSLTLHSDPSDNPTSPHQPGPTPDPVPSPWTDTAGADDPGSGNDPVPSPWHGNANGSTGSLNGGGGSNHKDSHDDQNARIPDCHTF
jgi:hypothetical protein